MSTQGGWRFCRKCQGLFFAGHPDQGACPSGDKHDSSASGPYVMTFGDDDMNARLQAGWRFCEKCQGLFFGGHADQGVCPAGGAHDARASGHYVVPMGDREVGGQSQAGWRFCVKCQGLFFGGHTDLGDCPAGAKHDPRASGHYLMLQRDPVVSSPISTSGRLGEISGTLSWVVGGDHDASLAAGISITARSVAKSKTATTFSAIDNVAVSFGVLALHGPGFFPVGPTNATLTYTVGRLPLDVLIQIDVKPTFARGRFEKFTGSRRATCTFEQPAVPAFDFDFLPAPESAGPNGQG